MKNYLDNNKKFVAVLNKKIELPKLLNALGHISIGITSLINSADSEFLCYKDADCSNHPAISKYPFIVLQADNGNQIRTLRKAAIEQGIVYNDFTDTMLGFSAEDQLNQTKNTLEVNLEYYGIVVFAESDKLHVLTKKFSLYKPSNGVGAPILEKKMLDH